MSSDYEIKQKVLNINQRFINNARHIAKGQYSGGNKLQRRIGGAMEINDDDKDKLLNILGKYDEADINSTDLEKSDISKLKTLFLKYNPTATSADVKLSGSGLSGGSFGSWIKGAWHDVTSTLLDVLHTGASIAGSLAPLLIAAGKPKGRPRKIKGGNKLQRRIGGAMEINDDDKDKLLNILGKYNEADINSTDLQKSDLSKLKTLFLKYNPTATSADVKLSGSGLSGGSFGSWIKGAWHDVTSTLLDVLHTGASIAGSLAPLLIAAGKPKGRPRKIKGGNAGWDKMHAEYQYFTGDNQVIRNPIGSIGSHSPKYLALTHPGAPRPPPLSEQFYTGAVPEEVKDDTVQSVGSGKKRKVRNVGKGATHNVTVAAEEAVKYAINPLLPLMDLIKYVKEKKRFNKERHFVEPYIAKEKASLVAEDMDVANQVAAVNTANAEQAVADAQQKLDDAKSAQGSGKRKYVKKNLKGKGAFSDFFHGISPLKRKQIDADKKHAQQMVEWKKQADDYNAYKKAKEDAAAAAAAMAAEKAADTPAPAATPAATPSADTPAPASTTGSGKRKASKWIEHVKKYAKNNNISYKDALKDKKCRLSYK
jgi:hypothetical protein